MIVQSNYAIAIALLSDWLTRQAKPKRIAPCTRDEPSHPSFLLPALHCNSFSQDFDTYQNVVSLIFYCQCCEICLVKQNCKKKIFPSFSWRIFAHVTRLDQSRASENI